MKSFFLILRKISLFEKTISKTFKSNKHNRVKKHFPEQKKNGATLFQLYEGLFMGTNMDIRQPLQSKRIKAHLAIVNCYQ